jgi:hypothetical protein
MYSIKHSWNIHQTFILLMEIGELKMYPVTMREILILVLGF